MVNSHKYICILTCVFCFTLCIKTDSGPVSNSFCSTGSTLLETTPPLYIKFVTMTTNRQAHRMKKRNKGKLQFHFKMFLVLRGERGNRKGSCTIHVETTNRKGQNIGQKEEVNHLILRFHFYAEFENV